MSSLRQEPAGRVHSLDELFALAYAIEASAADRFDETAKQLNEQGASHLADVFERLAQTERSHMKQVRGWAIEHGKDPADTSPPWPIPDMFDAYPDELARSKLLTPYRALALAVWHEERTFSFWVYVVAHATSAKVRKAAERMALEELERVSLLRRERRQAFHTQRRNSGPIEMTVDAATLAGEELRLAGLIEGRSPTLLENSEVAKEVAQISTEAAEKLRTLSAAHHPTVMVPTLPDGLNDDPLAISELLVEAYLTLADTAKDTSVVKVAQQLAGPAIYRLATLGSELEPGSQMPSWQLAVRSAKRKCPRRPHERSS